VTWLEIQGFEIDAGPAPPDDDQNMRQVRQFAMGMATPSPMPVVPRDSRSIRTW
jgi:hypothetical protein